ncbi:MAG: sodium-dependent transporter [Pyrinomonadaceae bacterium]
MESENSFYTSRLTTLLTLIGVAVGLGNVWRFPYMMGSYGGSAFLTVYLIFTFLFAVPALMAEMALGKSSRGGTLAAFTNAFGKGAGKLIGYLLLFTILISSSYYAVVVANVIFTTGFSMARGFGAGHLPQYESLLSNGLLQYGVNLLLIAGSLWIIHRGLNKGIEWVSKLIVPFFVIVILVLIFYALSLPGAFGHLGEFLKPDLTALTADQLFAALGQSFFSIGLGGTFMVVYGGYLKDEESIPKIALSTCLGDAGASLLASLFLVPTMLVYGLDMASGPGLIFTTMPKLFGQMPLGRLFGSLFLLALSAIAFLSLVAAYQVIVGSIDKEVFPRVRRSRIIIGLGLVQAALVLPSNLYPQIIGTLDLVFGSGMQIFGSVLAILGIVWGLGKNETIRQIFGAGEPTPKMNFTVFWLRWAVPAVLLAVLLGYVYSVLFPVSS